MLDLSDTGGTQTITGPAAGVTISGGGQSGVFQVNRGVTATLSGLTITDGSSNTFGGGVYNAGTATLTNCTISGNSATKGGAGVYNTGTATLTNCTVSGNVAGKGDGVYPIGSEILVAVGGGVMNDGTARLTNCTVSGNSATTAGGGVYNHGTATLANCTISGNSAHYGGGGVYNTGTDSTATLTNCTISGNSAHFGDGLKNFGIATLTNCTISGNSSITDGGYPYGTPILPGYGGGVYNDGTATLTNCTISRNFAFSAGGGVMNNGTATLTNCTISANPSKYGGGVLNAGTATLTNCTISANTSVYGGGVSNAGTATLTNCTISGNSATVGGGVESYVSAMATLKNCTLSGNSAFSGGGVMIYNSVGILTNCTISGNSAHNGGGVENYGSGTATLTNCTISGNSAGDGGGVYNNRIATLTNCTISGNSAGDGGGVYNVDSPTFSETLTDTIVAGNTGPSSAASDIVGTGSVTGSHNLIGTGGSGGLTNGQNGNIVLTSLAGLGLAPLAFYGGPTQTMALLVGSAAIGKGIAVTGVSTDQRGFPLDSPIDIGAFQTQVSTGKLVVNSTADGSGRQPGKLDLRGAVNLADVLTGAQTITFDPTVFATAQTIVLTTGELELSQTAGLETIAGPQAGVTISGGGTSQVFEVNASVSASLSGLTITGGLSKFGGGVANYGTATLTNCTISGNSAASLGGGVRNNGTATLTDCTLSGSSADVGGGVVNFGTATLTDCTLSGNSAGEGGGMENYGKATFANCTISGNQAKSGGGGVYNYYGTATLTDTIVAGNTGPSSAASDIAGTSSVTGSHNLIGTGGSGGLANGQRQHRVDQPDLLGLAPWAPTGARPRPWPWLSGSPALEPAGIAVSTESPPTSAACPAARSWTSAPTRPPPPGSMSSGFPSSTASGVSHSFTVNAVDPFGQPALDFNSPVSFSSSDPSAALAYGRVPRRRPGDLRATLNTPGTPVDHRLGRRPGRLADRHHRQRCPCDRELPPARHDDAGELDRHLRRAGLRHRLRPDQPPGQRHRHRPRASRPTPGRPPRPIPAPCRSPARPTASPPSGTRRPASPSTSTWPTARRTTWSCTSSTGTARAAASRCSSATPARARCWPPRRSRRSPMASTWTGRSRATC